MTEPTHNPLWNVANGIIAAMATVLGFFGAQLWSQGQKLSELTADEAAHQRENEKELRVIDRIDERQERNTRDVSILFGQNATQDALTKAVDVRVDKIRGLMDEGDARLEKEIQSGALTKEVDRLAKELDNLRNQKP